jgi:hypothetical protein
MDGEDTSLYNEVNGPLKGHPANHGQATGDVTTAF